MWNLPSIIYKFNDFFSSLIKTIFGLVLTLEEYYYLADNWILCCCHTL